jgi:hypothetical protein
LYDSWVQKEVPMSWYGLIPQDVGKGVTITDQRIRFISEYLDRYFPVNELYLQYY